MRRFLIISLLLGALSACGHAEDAAAPSASAGTPAAGMITVYKSPSCGCCHEWVAYMRRHGFTVAVQDTDDLAPLKAEHGVPASAQSCHMALVDGYVLEGHVPVAEVTRLLAERPAIAGLAVPGMPLGSPGMEVPGGQRDAFAVLAFDDQGGTTVFAQY